MLVFPREIRWLFLAIAIIVPTTWFAILIWALVRVPPHVAFYAKGGVGGNELSWGWLSVLNSALGGYATLGVNIPDSTVGYKCSVLSRLLM